MRKVKTIVAITLSVAFMAFFASCSDDDDDDGDEGIIIEITQADLDAADNVIQLNKTGGGFEHGGPVLGGENTFRDIFGSLANLPANIVPGTIITKKTWKADAGEKTDTLLVSFAMVKREIGYDAGNMDWEYLMIGFDEDNDYSVHPFGLLEKANRGKLQGCIDCHGSAGGGDFLWVND
jgi:hypothetical protein